MDILTDFKNVIKHICKIEGYEDNGNVLIIENGGKSAKPPQNINGQYKIEEIPEGVETEKYCYTEEKGFYKNENYVEPTPPAETQELLQKIALLEKQNKDLDEQITEIQLLIVEGGI